MVTDDPSRYPDRDSLTGGWAGGEVGLRQFIEVQHFSVHASDRVLAPPEQS